MENKIVNNEDEMLFLDKNKLKWIKPEMIQLLLSNTRAENGGGSDGSGTLGSVVS